MHQTFETRKAARSFNARHFKGAKGYRAVGSRGEWKIEYVHPDVNVGIRTLCFDCTWSWNS